MQKWFIAVVVVVLVALVFLIGKAVGSGDGDQAAPSTTTTTVVGNMNSCERNVLSAIDRVKFGQQTFAEAGSSFDDAHEQMVYLQAMATVADFQGDGLSQAEHVTILHNQISDQCG